MTEPPPEASPARPRVVLLGASNLTRAFSIVVETARLLLGGPLEIFTAAGLGRSYGLRSRVLGRGLPGIDGCGLWPALDARGPAETYALITDVGNDILYEAPPDAVVAWVRRCVERLRDSRRIIIATLPLGNLETLGRARFVAARTLLFPGRLITLEEVGRRATEIDSGLRDIAAEFGATVVEPRMSWYGIDPIHIRRRFWGSAWRERLAPWNPAAESPLARGSVSRWRRLTGRRAESWSIFGIERARPQPCAELEDGTTIACY